MSLRSRSIQIARTALRKELQLSSASSAQAWQRSLVAKNNMSVVPASSSYSVDFLTLRSFSTKPEDAAVEEESAAAADETNTAADESSGTDKAIADLEQQVKDLKDNLLRSLAEQENTRRIAKRDVEQARSFAISSFAKSLLETSDNLSRALDAVPEELRHDHDHHPVLATLYEGITMTDDGLTKAFTKNGLEKFGVPGEKFDPNLHEALFEYPDPAGEPGSIGQVMKKGFMLNQRVLRPAEVGVVKAP
jgi:molecular chaperone GrpE